MPTVSSLMYLHLEQTVLMHYQSRPHFKTNLTHLAIEYYLSRTLYLISYHCRRRSSPARRSRKIAQTKCSQWCKSTKTTHETSGVNCAQNASSSASTASVDSPSRITWWSTNAPTRALSSPSAVKSAASPSNGRTIYASIGKWTGLLLFRRFLFWKVNDLDVINWIWWRIFLKSVC